MRIPLTATLLLLCLGCKSKVDPKGSKPEIDPAEPPLRLEGVQAPEVRFKNVTRQAGIRFSHTNGASGNKLLPETMGSGVAFLDFNNDGRQDLLFVNSRLAGLSSDEDSTAKLYQINGDGSFRDVSAGSGLDVPLYGMGVTCGDYDNDGNMDVFLTAVGGNRLFKGDGKGTFSDMTVKMGVGGPGGWDKVARGKFLEHTQELTFSSSAAFLDYDGDGKLDLFVCNYVTWSPKADLDQPSTLRGGGRAYGPPYTFPGSACFLYRNTGERYEDVSAKSGVQVIETEGVDERRRKRAVGKSLGVVVCDVDDDGWPDVVVANDTVQNFFFHNVPAKDGGRTFVEKGTDSGIAYATHEGRARGAMGIDWGEYRPGRYALVIANFATEPCTFLSQADKLSFTDVAKVEGIDSPSRTPLKFGAFFFDYDLDGRLDLLTCNGHLEPAIAAVEPGQTYPQAAQLFWNTGDSRLRFLEVLADRSGKDLFEPLVGRGCAYGDVDCNGTPDVVLTANGGPAQLLRNEGGTGHHWLRLVLRGDGKRSNRSAIGAKVEVKVGGQVIRREVIGARGYLSQSELPITVGLGQATKVDSVSIRWPGRNAGAPQVIANPKIDHVHVIDQK